MLPTLPSSWLLRVPGLPAGLLLGAHLSTCVQQSSSLLLQPSAQDPVLGELSRRWAGLTFAPGESLPVAPRLGQGGLGRSTGIWTVSCGSGGLAQPGPLRLVSLSRLPCLSRSVLPKASVTGLRTRAVRENGRRERWLQTLSPHLKVK